MEMRTEAPGGPSVDGRQLGTIGHSSDVEAGRDVTRSIDHRRMFQNAGDVASRNG
jgi:hypothetical protein